MTYLVPLVILAVLIFVNAIFVAAEFAIVASRSFKLEALADQSASARQALKIVQNTRLQDRFIAVAQLGITLVTVALGMYAEPTIAGWLYGPLQQWFGLSEAVAHTVATVFVLGVITYLHVVIGEMIPKAMALHSPEGIATGVMPAMRFLNLLFLPGVWVLNAIAGAFLRMMTLPLQGGHRLYTANELEMLVRESSEGGEIESEQSDLIEAIFDFGEREVYQCMTPRPRVKGLPLDATEADLIELMVRSKHSRFPVYEGDLDHIRGILHVKDFIRWRSANEGEAFDLRPLLRRAPRVPLHMSSARLLASFKRLRVHMAVVMDEYGGTEGIVTLEDLIEEVVGEVYDEHDHESLPEINEMPDGSLLVEGEVLLEDFNELYPDSLISDDANTVGGLVVEELGRAPQVGDVVGANGAELTVQEVDGLAVTRVVIRLPEAPPEEEETTGE